MPAIDNCEKAVITALKKEGWSVTDRPYPIRIGKKFVFADLKLSNNQNDEIIVVEVKCFPVSRSAIDEFYGAIGQYLLYRTALNEQDLFEPVFLSIPERIYSTLIQEPIIQTLLKETTISLIVVNIEREVIIKWLP